MSETPNVDTWTVQRLLDWTRGHFEQNAVESPRLCAEILLAHAIGCERIELYTRYHSTPDEAALSTFRTSVKQAAEGRPIAHLTGEKEFFSLAFEVTPDVLVPRPETEILVERVISLARQKDNEIKTILDVGVGSGCIAISLAKNLPEAAFSASDISEAALAVARRNAARHEVSARIDFRAGDLCSPWDAEQQFDAIVSNPPYIAETEAADLPTNVRDYEPSLALFSGPDGLDVVRRLAAETPPHLKPNGHLLMEIAYNQAADVTRLLDESGWRDIVTYKDDLGHQRVVHARRRK